MHKLNGNDPFDSLRTSAESFLQDQDQLINTNGENDSRELAIEMRKRVQRHRHSSVAITGISQERGSLTSNSKDQYQQTSDRKGHDVEILQIDNSTNTVLFVVDRLIDLILSDDLVVNRRNDRPFAQQSRRG